MTLPIIQCGIAGNTTLNNCKCQYNTERYITKLLHSPLLNKIICMEFKKKKGGGNLVSAKNKLNTTILHKIITSDDDGDLSLYSDEHIGS